MYKMADTEDKVTVFVSTIPGLEFICVAECDEVFEVKSKKEGRGRVSLSTSIRSLPKLSKLKSVHHFWLQVYRSSKYFAADTPKDSALESLEKLIDSLNWRLAVYALNYFKTTEAKDNSGRECNITLANEKEHNATQIGSQFLFGESASIVDHRKRKVEEDKNSEQKSSKLSQQLDFASFQEKPPALLDVKKGTSCIDSEITVIGENNASDPSTFITFLRKKPAEIKFRVTCNRTGKHDFTSMEAARYIGSGVKGYFGWNVDLENYDIEILAFIDNHEITVAIKLSQESKHSRNVKYFGPTTLRATTSYCMLKLAGVKPGSKIEC